MSVESYLDWDDILASLSLQLRDNNTLFDRVCGKDPIVILRDWKGCLHLCLPCDAGAISEIEFSPVIQNVNAVLGPLSAAQNGRAEIVLSAAQIIDDFVIYRGDLFDPEDIWNSPNLVVLDKSESPSIYLLDRQDKENDWLKSVAPVPNISTPRAIFFGAKGGVGRSSALTALALRLANEGKRVLVVDADFESPGVSSSLLSSDAKPNYGIIDWLTAQALGHKDLENLALQQLVETSPLSSLTSGKILIAPSYGAKTQAYVSKLGRVYRTTNDGAAFAQRLNGLVSTLEDLHKADVTLIDSRAGIDDTAAAAITQLGARVTFMFAINTQQTWDAYSILFKHLQRHPTLHTENDFRTQLRLVSALTPEEASLKGYWSAFRESAYQTCANGLYDAMLANEDEYRFNFGFDDEDAPHFPLRITWDEVLRAFDPVREPSQLSPPVILKVFDDFLTRAQRLLN